MFVTLPSQSPHALSRSTIVFNPLQSELSPVTRCVGVCVVCPSVSCGHARCKEHFMSPICARKAHHVIYTSLSIRFSGSALTLPSLQTPDNNLLVCLLRTARCRYAGIASSDTELHVSSETIHQTRGLRPGLGPGLGPGLATHDTCGWGLHHRPMIMELLPDEQTQLSHINTETK